MNQTPFIRFLVTVAEQRDGRVLGALRSLLHGSMLGASYVERFLGPEDEDGAAEVAYLVAGLVGLFPTVAGPNGVGHSIADAYRQVAARTPRGHVDASGAAGRGMYDREMEMLLGAVRQDLPRRLQHLLGVCAREKEAIDVGRLLADLLAWEEEGRPVQHRLAREMWGIKEEETV